MSLNKLKRPKWESAALLKGWKIPPPHGAFHFMEIFYFVEVSSKNEKKIDVKSNLKISNIKYQI